MKQRGRRPAIRPLSLSVIPRLPPRFRSYFKLTESARFSCCSNQTGLARFLSESPSGARPIASLHRSSSSASRASTTFSSLLASSPFHSSPSSLQQIEDVVRDPISPPKTTASAPRGGSSDSSSGGDAFLSLPEVRAATRGPLSVYAARRRAGLYRKDPRQESAMLELQRLFGDIEASAAPSTGLTMMGAIGDSGGGGGGGGSWLSSLFGGSSSDSASSASDSSSSSVSSALSSSPRGLYMYGGVGTGKTMLMDVFSECTAPLVPVSFFFLF